MPSDIGRKTLDPTRRYHGIVKQQGRVSLEADDNEALALIGEQMRAEMLDVVGPAGTPDNGYEISGGLPPFDFNVGPGTMYVGGMRVTLAPGVPYSTQPDWTDHTGDPLWIDPAQPATQPQELIYLSLREQEVSAVEDTPLREVALGGPDTAQRQRLIQRIVRLGTTARDCAGAQATAIAQWATLGLEFKPLTMRLESTARLQATYEDPGGTTDPCEPDAHGGYLGAENQLIRVQVSAADRFVWGFDNASFLYRVNVIDAQTVELQSTPVDAFHFPRTGQAVELLRTAAVLSDVDAIASDTGVVQTLASPYNPDTRRISLPAPLPAEYLDAAETPAVFLRVWEEEESFVTGTAVSLGTTGLQVTLTGGAPYHLGDYWMIAVRPSTPTAVYPRRYLEAPQPPEGPRLWVCPLAVIDWSSGAFDLLEDCRNHFDDLVDLTKRRCEGCCTVTVGDGTTSEGEFRDIEAAIAAAVSKVPARDDPVRVCILPGVHRISQTVTVKAKNLTISGCGAQSIVVMEDDGPAFLIAASETLTLEALTIVSRSEPGTVLVLGSSEVRILNCRIINAGKSDSVLDVHPALSAGDLDDQPAVDFTIADSVLEAVPAATLRVQRARVYRTTMPRGGIWLREGCEDVVLSNNEIGPGAGPGILLGGRLAEEKPPDQVVGLSHIQIVENRIAGMEASGIATSSGRTGNNGPGRGFSVIDDLSIVNNRIEDCVQSESAIAFDQEAVGGIVLRQVLDLRIHENYIVRNGTGSKLAACGIFLSTCVAAAVTNNTIDDNGSADPKGEGDLFQGGIIGLLLLGSALGRGNKYLDLRAGRPSLFCHDNVVVSPRGQALIVAAIGSVSVADNSLTTLEAGDQPAPLFNAGRCVFILNLGRPPGIRSELAYYGVNTTSHLEYVGTTAEGINLKAGAAASSFPDGRVLFHDNQVALNVSRELPDVLRTGSAVIVSADDVSLQDNQFLLEPAEGLGFNVATGAATVEASSNRFAELPGRVILSYFSWAQRNIATGNQATHCILVLGPSTAVAHNLVQITAFCELLESLFPSLGGG